MLDPKPGTDGVSTVEDPTPGSATITVHSHTRKLKQPKVDLVIGIHALPNLPTRGQDGRRFHNVTRRLVVAKERKPHQGHALTQLLNSRLDQ